MATVNLGLLGKQIFQEVMGIQPQEPSLATQHLQCIQRGQQDLNKYGLNSERVEYLSNCILAYGDFIYTMRLVLDRNRIQMESIQDTAARFQEFKALSQLSRVLMDRYSEYTNAIEWLSEATSQTEYQDPFIKTVIAQVFLQLQSVKALEQKNSTGTKRYMVADYEALLESLPE